MVSSDRVQITLTGGAPWGFRLSGGGGMPLIINKIRKKSQAHVRGLKEGDAVISINGVHVHDKTQDEALELVEAAGDSLVLEIFRGDKNERDQNKPQKLIQVATSHRAPAGTIRLLTTSDDGVSPGEVVLIPSGDSVTSESLATADARPGLSVSRVIAFSSPGRVLEVRSASNTAVLGPAPGISREVRPRDTHSATSASNVTAKPFYVTQAGSESPPYFQPNQPQPVRPPPPPPTGPGPQTSITLPQSHTTPQPPRFSSQPPRAPPPPPVSPKPQRYPSPQPASVAARPSGVTTTIVSSSFDGGQGHRQVTREQHVQKLPDGRSTTIIQQEVTTTSGRPSFVKGQATAFNAVQPRDIAPPTQKSYRTTTTTLKSTTSIVSQKGPTPFVSSAPSNILQQQYQTAIPPASYSTDNQFQKPDTQLFKPTKFVPTSGRKDTPGFLAPSSPMVDYNVQGGFKDGKENVSPQPMFQVKNIVSDKSSAPEIWRPNMWLPGQQPPSPYDQPQTATPREEPPVGTSKPGYSFVEEQKRKLLASHAPKQENNDGYGQEAQDQDEDHHRDHRLHIFAPPVEIHADEDAPHHAYEDLNYMDDSEDGQSSSDSTGARRKKKLYSDSAFYNTPGKSYPTITEQMKLCKKIAQSLTSAANKRARGAKMFMKRKRKSSKWIHEGHSEISSSAGDVANIHELDSELNTEDGGNKQLLYFKIPSIKQRVGNEAKQTKMSLTKEQFEQLRLSSKRCDHKSLAPDPCFDIVADLKAHKGKGGRMFEKRKERSDKFIIDETNAKFPLPHGKSDNMTQSADHHLDPREVAMRHGWKGDPAALQNTQIPLVPLVHSSLKSEDSPMLLKTKNFNRLAKGWSGGGEYPVAERLQHISPIRQLAPSQPSSTAQQQKQQENYNKVQAWQSNVESFSAADRFRQQDYQQPGARQQDYQQPGARQQDYQQPGARQQDYQQPGARQQDYQQPGARQQDYQQPGARQQEYQQQRRQDDSRRSGWDEKRPNPHQNARPKSWHQGSYDTQQVTNQHDYHYPTVDYRYGSGQYPSVAYKQPIIPGTDL